MKHLISNTSSTKHLPDVDYDYLDIAYQSCKEFQERIRKAGDRSFNIWLYLEDQFKRHHLKENLHRKPPKAVTIEQWFAKNHLSGSKMGTEDLKLICRFVNNSDAIIAFYEETIKEFFPQSTDIINDTSALNKIVLKLGSLQGQLFDEYSEAEQDGITSEEAARIIAATDAVEKQCLKIKSKLTLKKAS